MQINKEKEIAGERKKKRSSIAIEAGAHQL